ncbi:polysaccharide export outer membrane protein [Chitinophaga costaii]|uniref:Polysaccharide export outer membrane protein n=1 Tax=Chitinophaga costaii TaxID=1335309 RepID=A0A1C4CNB9_9BACT|nr:response regulator [Chitinophaga costaii]SCC20588.1 polysaccharide export outer membrane protein [Chitinophaga costaii]
MVDKFKRKIFLVDDDSFSLTMYTAFLDAQGYKNIMGFSSGEAVLEMLKEEPDIILLDHQPGVLTGLEILEKIKRYDPNIYVVFISGRYDKKMGIEAVKGGAFDYITKEAALMPKILEVMNRIFTVQDYLIRIHPKPSRFFLI